MRCESHPESDAIGQCSRCSRALCAECAVRLEGAMHCKHCVDSATRSPASHAAVAAAPPPAGIPASYPHPPPPLRLEPRPRGRPAGWPFAVGSVGAIGGGITMMLSAPFGGLGFSGVLYGSPYGSTLYALPVVLAIVTATFQTMFAIGLCGLWKNYGSGLSLAGGIAVIAGAWVSASIFAALSLAWRCEGYCPGVVPSPYYSGGLSALYSIPIGIGLIIGGIGFHSAAPYHADPRAVKSVGILLATGGLILAVACLAFAGWVTAGVAELVALMIFRTAPVPAAAATAVARTTGESPSLAKPSAK